MQHGYPQLQISFAGMSWAGAPAPGVSTITAIDPSFDGDEFLTFAQGAFLRVHEARAAGRIDDIRPVVSETIWPSFRTAMTAKAPAVRSLEHATIYDAHRDAAVDSVTVRFAAKTAARRKNDLVEDWTFQRPAVTGRQSLPDECPSCGAPLSLDERGDCRYCRVNVAGARGGWKVVRAAPPPAPARAGSGARTWLIFWIVFMILMTVVLPIGILLAVTKTTNDAFSGFGLGSSNTTLDGPAARSATNEKVGQTPTSTARSGALIAAQTTLTGAVTGTFDGGVVTTGGGVGTCARRAAKVTGITFSIAAPAPDQAGQQVKRLDVSLRLPSGTQGPGTYDLATTPLKIDLPITVIPPGGGEVTQSWELGAGSTATFELGADDSGTLTFAALRPALPAQGALATPLSGTVRFTCA